MLESVFECDLALAQYNHMERKLRKRLDGDTDRLQLYFMCADCRVQTRIVGGGTLEQSSPFYIV